MKFKLRSTNFESICHEFARKMYEKLSFDDKAFHFSERGVLKHRFETDPILLEAFNNIAAIRLEPEDWGLAFESINEYMSDQHKLYLTGLVKRFKKGELLQAPEMAMAGFYLRSLSNTPDTNEKPVQSRTEAVNAVEHFLIDLAYKAFLEAEDILWINEVLTRDNVIFSPTVDGMYELQGINAYHRSRKYDPIQYFRVQFGIVTTVFTKHGRIIDMHREKIV